MKVTIMQEGVTQSLNISELDCSVDSSSEGAVIRTKARNGGDFIIHLDKAAAAKVVAKPAKPRKAPNREKPAATKTPAKKATAPSPSIPRRT